MIPYDKILEQLIQQFTGPEFQREVLEAKREFFERAGIVDEEAINFETRMPQFLDWYMFSRELSTVHLAPVNYFVENHRADIDPQSLVHYENLTKSIHSLFEFKKLRESDLTIYDLFEKKKYTLEDSAITAGFNPDEIFEARIIPLEKTWVFSRGFCFHPL